MNPADLRTISAQTLVIAGTRDMIRRKHTRLIADSLPHAKPVFLNGDHCIAAKQPEAFNAAVLELLTKE